jgi:hypothetical protein
MERAGGRDAVPGSPIKRFESFLQHLPGPLGSAACQLVKDFTDSVELIADVSQQRDHVQPVKLLRVVQAIVG